MERKHLALALVSSFERRRVIVLGDVNYAQRWFYFYLVNRGVEIEVDDDCQAEDDSNPGQNVE